MTPSNANTSGLVEFGYRWRQPDWHPDDWELDMDPLAKDKLDDRVIEPLVTAASAQAMIDAAEARANRLAKALEPFARVARWARLCGMADLEKATAKYAKRNLFWDHFSAADAALSGDTDHAG